ncbi:eukaryotic aspartyl protease [Opisthorchis viverrini]|uniref:Eukaryotic aspartyl protease n=1 Tax=Opisthorchis viverrini TaxID=6198 RepID=A0A1S8X3R0_OPIVI|nr:eukaryotic aspartyl protease [Opisthorchis viverrini]
MFDTGSPILWVPSMRLAQERPMVRSAYNPDDSMSIVRKPRSITIQYGNYIATGDIFSELVKLNGHPFRTEFSAINKIEGYVDQLYTIDGLFGLAKKQYYKQFKATPLDDMDAQKVIPKRQFAFIFKRGGVSGTVVFGDISKAHIPGTVNYVPVSKEFANKHEWIIKIRSITYEDGTVLASDLSALLDTGAYRTYLPTSFANRLFSGIWKQMNLDSRLVRCDAMYLMPTLLLNLEGHQLKWEPSQYIEQLDIGQCESTIQPADLPFSYNALMGISFLRHFAVIYDVDNDVVGFAEPI